MNAIEAEHLTKRFRLLNSYRDLLSYPWRRPVTVAVDDLTLSIQSGELFGLLGENGAGKTTLIQDALDHAAAPSGSARWSATT